MPKSKVITHKKWTAYHGDLKLSLRKTGNSLPSITVEVDEGDGIEFYIREQEISDKCRDEWIGQLEVIIEKLRKLKPVDKPLHEKLGMDQRDLYY